MEKQAIQLSKMEEVDKLKLQLEALERERKEVMKDLESWRFDLRIVIDLNLYYGSVLYENAFRLLK